MLGIQETESTGRIPEKSCIFHVLCTGNWELQHRRKGAVWGQPANPAADESTSPLPMYLPWRFSSRSLASKLPLLKAADGFADSKASGTLKESYKSQVVAIMPGQTEKAKGFQNKC